MARNYYDPGDNVYDDEEDYFAYLVKEDAVWLGEDNICPLNCDFPESDDHTLCAAVAERLEKYSQPTEKSETVSEEFKKRWKFWLYLHPNTAEGDTESEQGTELVPIYTIKHGWSHL